MNTALQEVHDVIARLPHQVDAKRWADLRRLFADEVDMDYTSLLGGAPARQKAADVVAGWQERLGPVSTQHLLGPIVATVDGAKASAECHVHASHQAHGGEWILLGHYEFALEQQAGAWVITRMKLLVFHERGSRKVMDPRGD